MLLLLIIAIKVEHYYMFLCSLFIDFYALLCLWFNLFDICKI